MRKRILTAAVAAATLASGAQAAGFYLKEQSVVGQGRAFAGSAAGTDGASAAYFNPAGIVGVEKQVEFGIHYIKPDTEVSDNGSNFNGTPIDSALLPGTLLLGSNVEMGKQEPYDGKPVPNFHYVHPLDDTTAASIYVGAPFGFGNEYDEDYFGQYDSLKNELSVIELSASLAKALSDTLNVAFSLNYQSLDVEQTAQSGPNIISTLKGDATEIGYVLSFQKQYGDTTVGFSHRSETTHDVTGTQSFFNKTTKAPQQPNATTAAVVDATATFGLPSITALGLAHQATESTSYYADVTFYGWSNYERGNVTTADSDDGFPEGTIINPAISNYKDTLSFAVGMDHNYGNGLTVRAGVHYDPTPTVDAYRSTSTPDGDRTWLATGFSKEVNEALTIDGALTYILVDDGIVDKSTVKTFGTINTKAKAEGSVGIVSLGFRYKF